MTDPPTTTDLEEALVRVLPAAWAGAIGWLVEAADRLDSQESPPSEPSPVSDGATIDRAARAEAEVEHAKSEARIFYARAKESEARVAYWAKRLTEARAEQRPFLKILDADS